jgi:hypothetical protein
VRLADTALRARETAVTAGHGAAQAGLVGLCRLRGIVEEQGAVVVAAEQEEAVGAATRLPVFLQTLLATEELTIPAPKVDDDREALRAKHHLSTRFVLAVRFFHLLLLFGAKADTDFSEADKDGGAARQ